MQAPETDKVKESIEEHARALLRKMGFDPDGPRNRLSETLNWRQRRYLRQVPLIV